MHTLFHRCGMSLACCLGLQPHLAALAQQSVPVPDTTPPVVYARVQLVRDELELIRFVMGRRQDTRPELQVSGASPREVYFQALTLFRKSEQLCFEHVRQHTRPPKRPVGAIQPSDVLTVVEAAHQQILRVKQKLGIEASPAPTPPDPRRTPTDVFQAIVQANRQLNLLLDHRVTPGDVFEQVTVAIAWTSRLLEHFPEATALPDAPEFEPGKQPVDVYRRLLNCFTHIRRIAEFSGLRILQLEEDAAGLNELEPSDVYDIASLVVSELSWLHSRLPDARPPRSVYFMGRRFPSHVFQRAGILERQLLELKDFASRHPDWLTRNEAAR